MANLLEPTAMTATVQPRSSKTRLVSNDLVKYCFPETWPNREQWDPHFEGRQIPVATQFFPIEVIGDLVSKYTDPLPEHVFIQLHSYMQDAPHGDLIAELERRPTYDVGGSCLRKIIERRREAKPR